jgi:hypothetical protein
MRKSERIVILLVLLQAVSLVMLWSLDSLTRAGQVVFTLFLAVDLISLGVIAHVYRTTKDGADLRRGWIVTAGVVIFLLLIMTILVS